MLRHTTLCAFVVVIMAMGSIYAQGRRGEICADLWGEPGFGLCNAYCEAKKCDSTDQIGSDNSCSQILANFQEVSNKTMPCGEYISPGSQGGSCPCNFGVQFWTSKTPQIVKTENATAFTCTWLNSDDPFTLMNLIVDSSSTQDTLTFVAQDPSMGGACAYDVHLNTDAEIITTPGGELPVTSEQFPACADDIAALRSAYLTLCGQ